MTERKHEAENEMSQNYHWEPFVLSKNDFMLVSGIVIFLKLI